MEVTSKIYRQGPWQLPYKATGVICPDGVRRTVKLHHTPDTFWTIPARLSYKNTTVSGVIMSANEYDTDDGEDLRFVARGVNKNIFVGDSYKEHPPPG